MPARKLLPPPSWIAIYTYESPGIARAPIFLLMEVSQSGNVTIPTSPELQRGKQRNTKLYYYY